MSSIDGALAGILFVGAKMILKKKLDLKEKNSLRYVQRGILEIKFHFLRNKKGRNVKEDIQQ